jgi:hypothetical protein
MMTAVLIALALISGADGNAPTIVVDDRPEAGVPPEAEAQKNDKEFPAGGARTFHTLTKGTIKTVRIRYFNKKTWATEEQAREYVAGFLAHDSREQDVFGFQIWSESVGVPEIECLVDFTDEYREKLRNEQKPCREGRLLIWTTESCFRDATGRWWFVNAFDHFHRFHPKGDSKLSRNPKK